MQMQGLLTCVHIIVQNCCTQHRAVLIIFPHNVQTIIIALMLFIGEEGDMTGRISGPYKTSAVSSTVLFHNMQRKKNKGNLLTQAGQKNVS